MGCCVEGCDSAAPRKGRLLDDGTYETLCNPHHDIFFAAELGVSVDRWKRLKKYRPFIKRGFSTEEIKQELFEKHLANNSRARPYYEHRKNYCENRDGRLGFKCTYTEPDLLEFAHMGPGLWLAVDHIDGNHENHVEENCQTLCHNCHHVKGLQEGDSNKSGWEFNNVTHQELIDFFDRVVIWRELESSARPKCVDKIKLNYQRILPSNAGGSKKKI